MSELTTRTLVGIIGGLIAVVGCVGFSELVHPSRTVIGSTTMIVRFFGPAIALIGALVFAASRRIPKKAVPSPRGLVGAGLALIVMPLIFWAAGQALAPVDTMYWAPVVAAGLLLLATPGVGMIFGGGRRLVDRSSAPLPTAQPAPKIRRKK